MRPRFLIDLIESCISIAVNRGHSRVEEDDIVTACRQHSYYLISDFGYEIRDVSSITHDIFYAFIGVGELVTHDEVTKALGQVKIEESQIERVIDLLLWYGFLGIAYSDTRKMFIFDLEYDFHRLKAEVTKNPNEVLYCINPAFLDGLMH